MLLFRNDFLTIWLPCGKILIYCGAAATAPRVLSDVQRTL